MWSSEGLAVRGVNPYKAGGIVLVGIYGVLCAASPSTYRFLDRVDLVFHEAGHVIFGFFGEFLGILGGSIMQVLIPAVVVAYFFFHRQSYSAAVALFLVAQSLFNVSVYVNDARARVLPLLGDDISAHDWYNILGRLHLLTWDQAIGNLIFLLGLLSITASVAGGLYFSREQVQEE